MGWRLAFLSALLIVTIMAGADDDMVLSDDDASSYAHGSSFVWRV